MCSRLFIRIYILSRLRAAAAAAARTDIASSVCTYKYIRVCMCGNWYYIGKISRTPVCGCEADKITRGPTVVEFLSLYDSTWRRRRQKRVVTYFRGNGQLSSTYIVLGNENKEKKKQKNTIVRSSRREEREVVYIIPTQHI